MWQKTPWLNWNSTARLIFTAEKSKNIAVTTRVLQIINPFLVTIIFHSLRKLHPVFTARLCSCSEEQLRVQGCGNAVMAEAEMKLKNKNPNSLICHVWKCWFIRGEIWNKLLLLYPACWWTSCNVTGKPGLNNNQQQKHWLNHLAPTPNNPLKPKFLHQHLSAKLHQNVLGLSQSSH